MYSHYIEYYKGSKLDKDGKRGKNGQIDHHFPV